MSKLTDDKSSAKEGGSFILKLKWSITAVLAFFLVVMLPSTSSHAAKENKVAELKNTTAKFFVKPTKKAKFVKSKKADLKRTYYVRESKKADGTTYYRLEKGTKSLGWVDQKTLKLTNRTLLSKSKGTMYAFGNGYAYTMPATTSANRSYSLKIRRGVEFKVERYEKLGTKYYYKGTIAGTKKKRWIRSDYITTNGYVSVNLRKPSGVTTKQLQNLILSKGKSTSNILYKLAPEFVKAEKSTGVNAQFMFAHAALETGWGSSLIAQYKNNLFGYQAYDTCPVTCSKYFPKGEDGLKLYASRIVNNYLVKSGPYYNGMSVLDMNVRYATDKEWGSKIAFIMQQTKTYNASHYAKAKASTIKVAAAKDFGSEIPKSKAQPKTFVKMPTKVTGKVNVATATVYSVPYIYSPRIAFYKKGQKITLDAYHTDVKEFKNSKGGQSRWYRIAYKGKQGWVRSDQIKTENLAFTTIDATLRSNAGTKYQKVGNAVKNTPLKLVYSSNKLVTKKDSTKKTWYQAYNPSAPTKKIWVRSDLIKIYR